MKHFTIEELCRSNTARQKGIDNIPTPEIRQKLETLILRLLDPVRSEWGSPITVTSGYRCPELNRAVGGAVSSQHMKGEAADITAGNREKNRRLFEQITRMAQTGQLRFDQLIDEKNYQWIHVSYRADGNRNQILHLQ